MRIITKTYASDSAILFPHKSISWPLVLTETTRKHDVSSTKKQFLLQSYLLEGIRETQSIPERISLIM